MYFKLRCNSTQFVMYYKLRNYYKLQRNTDKQQFRMITRDVRDRIANDVTSNNIISRNESEILLNKLINQ